ncbi:hypothetical protein MCOR27_008248 [Pyricularia oryzae]|uniref:Uncharacterized protein n=3 Tax=Pyricularia oryzae TaxID=318829 RepID=G4MRC4_PYRO7|nr:uncharacterized protein MGG_16508 [Pyricularia oryzae 70-15]ELQ39389.1 hypothetical protein OOU_Y34scaffold00500g36 [Pyricularia oryzae Y34]KAH9429213.1 hypothetical protein MCOR02_010622 [Pyricularia oryzae]EHA58249.1 hypothetical protein MGG_16508 [Pyricularia oryzae 70-15]KAI6272649.1 hypothetical protein MCOR27_008248 [Pyricularia oryzae]KAI6324736.1 hypothetical protein MCOR34_001389 [Pyricularia oryzae]
MAWKILRHPPPSSLDTLDVWSEDRKEVVMVMCSGKTEEKVTATVDGKNMSSNGDHFINHLEHLCSSTGLVYS